MVTVSSWGTGVPSPPTEPNSPPKNAQLVPLNITQGIKLLFKVKSGIILGVFYCLKIRYIIVYKSIKVSDPSMLTLMASSNDSIHNLFLSLVYTSFITLNLLEVST